MDTSMVPDLLVKPSLLPQVFGALFSPLLVSLRSLSFFLCPEPGRATGTVFFDCLVEVMKRKGALRNFHKPKLPQKPPSMTFHRYMELLHEFGV